MKIAIENNYKIQLYTTSLMILVASSDDKIIQIEMDLIEEKIKNLFNINPEESKKIIIESQEIIKDATDIFDIGSYINESISYEEKKRLIKYLFKIANIDHDFNFMERHIIDKIANILNISTSDLKMLKKI